jgi:hypothetical protein
LYSADVSSAVSHTDIPLSQRGWVALLVVTPLVAVALWWVVGGGVRSLVLLGMAIPMLVVLVPLVLIAREVASHPDDPEEVEGRLAASLGLSKAELEKRTDEGDPADWER